MLKKHVIAGAIAALFAGTVAVAQTPQTPSSERPQNPPTAAAAPAAAGETTLSGCVYKEEDVPGRTPNVAERAGVMEDYILADVKAAGHSSTSPSSSTPGATPGVAGTSGTVHPMYKLEKIADERLRSMVGKRVEVTGKIDAERGDATKTPAAAEPRADKNPGSPDKVELPEFEVTEIREVAGTCPAKPAAR
jgi:hypothetical protein